MTSNPDTRASVIDAERQEGGVIVLGGSLPHVPLIQNLKKRGYRVLLIDFLSNPPGREYADRHLQENGYNIDVVYNIARRERASKVITTSLDHPIQVAATVSEMLQLPCPISSRVAMMVTDKITMKTEFDRLGVHTCRWTTVSSDRTQTWNQASKLTFPLVAKLSNGTGSTGVKFLHSHCELEAWLNDHYESHSVSRNLIEEYVSGQELSVDCIISKGNAHVLTYRIREKTFFDNETKSVCHAGITTTDLKESIKKIICDLAQSIASGFGLRDSPLLIQGIVDGNGHFSVLEIAARLGGSPCAFYNVKQKSGVDLLDAAIDCQLGVSPSIQLNMSTREFATNLLYARSGKLGSISGLADLKERGVIKEYFLFRSVGDDIPDGMSVRNRVAAVITEGENIEDLRGKAIELFENVNISDPSGQSLLHANIGMHYGEQRL